MTLLSRRRQHDTGAFGISNLPPFEQGRVDPRSWFEQPQLSLQIEIGCGKATFLVQEAPAHPDVNYLGIEQSPEFYRYAADRARRRELSNMRILRADAVEFFRFFCAEGVAAVIHLYFSDPWPKRRHHKRRVIQDRTLVELHRALEPGGELQLVTDHDDLWAWYEDHVARHANLFERRAFDRVESAGEGEIVGSNFERKYRREGRSFFGMVLKKQ